MEISEATERLRAELDARGIEWVDASDGGTLDVYCPANGEQLSVIADATKEDVDRAVDAAWEAFETWSKTTKAERAIILNKVADLIEENAEKFALLESLDNGKPIRETRAIDVAYSVDHFRYFAGVLLADTAVKAATVDVVGYSSPANGGTSFSNEVILTFTGDSGAVKQAIIAARDVGMQVLKTLEPSVELKSTTTPYIL